MEIMPKSYIKNENGYYYYSEDEWKDKYIEYLKDASKKEPDPYYDPDTIKAKKEYNGVFYKNTCTFLNKREEWLEEQYKKSGWKEWKKWTYKTKDNELGIFVYVDNILDKPIWRLHSDQFGFSAPDDRNIKCENNKMKIGYPYDVYLSIKKDNEDARKDVASWIFKTRELGGAFIWPTNGVGNARCTINCKRGTSYIEDRVDYTLNLIKLHYKTKGKDDCFGIQQESVQSWLDHFNNFNTYVQFFMFDGFCKKKGPDYKIKNIFRPHEQIDNVDTKTKRIEKCACDNDCETLKEMLNFVANQIENRSKKMEKTIRVVKR